MNRTKIEWTDYSWNPITGCKHGCWYCYAYKLFQRFNKSFEPTFYPERLDEPFKLKKPSKIFCCSVSDLFAKWTKPNWRKKVITVIKKCPQHTFQLLTKQPQNIRLKPINNVWMGVTITSDKELYKLCYLVRHYEGFKFASFEPLLSPIQFKDRCIDDIDWVIIGKLTGSKRVELQKKWVDNLIEQIREKNIPIFIKDNVGWNKKIQEFPHRD